MNNHPIHAATAAAIAEGPDVPPDMNQVMTILGQLTRHFGVCLSPEGASPEYWSLEVPQTIDPGTFADLAAVTNKAGRIRLILTIRGQEEQS